MQEWRARGRKEAGGCGRRNGMEMEEGGRDRKGGRTKRVSVGRQCEGREQDKNLKFEPDSLSS